MAEIILQIIESTHFLLSLFKKLFQFYDYEFL